MLYLTHSSALPAAVMKPVYLIPVLFELIWVKFLPWNSEVQIIRWGRSFHFNVHFPNQKRQSESSQTYQCKKIQSRFKQVLFKLVWDIWRCLWQWFKLVWCLVIEGPKCHIWFQNAFTTLRSVLLLNLVNLTFVLGKVIATKNFLQYCKCSIKQGVLRLTNEYLALGIKSNVPNHQAADEVASKEKFQDVFLYKKEFQIKPSNLILKLHRREREIKWESSGIT